MMEHSADRSAEYSGEDKEPCSSRTGREAPEEACFAHPCPRTFSRMILVGRDVSLLTGLRAVQVVQQEASSDSSDVGAETWVLVSFLFPRYPLIARFLSLYPDHFCTQHSLLPQDLWILLS